MSADRALRDELEQLQVQARALEEEHAVPHSAEFLKSHSALEASLATEKAQAAQATATRDELRSVVAELMHQRDSLLEQLRIVEQKRLGLVLLAVVAALLTLLFFQARVEQFSALLAPLAFGAVTFVLFPRAWSSRETVTPQAFATRASQVVLNLTVRNEGLLPLGAAMAAWYIPLSALAHGQLESERDRFVTLHLVLLAALSALVLAGVVYRRAGPAAGLSKVLAAIAEVVAFLPLQLSLLAGLSSLSSFWQGWSSEEGGRTLLGEIRYASDFLPLLIAGPVLALWRLDGFRKEAARRPYALPVSLLLTAMAWGCVPLAWLSQGMEAGWNFTSAAVQLTVGALLFAVRCEGDKPKSWQRRVAVGAALTALAGLALAIRMPVVGY